ncbi:MAG: NEW3 domain-containing protein [Balneolales bacterium]|nr:NEW3 domain-containing protein [Balneolales bacterium]
MYRRLPYLFLVLLFLVPEISFAQSPFPNARDDSYPLLGLKRAKSSYERAQSELRRKEDLYLKELISREEYETALNTYSDAEVNYQQSLLVLLFEQQFVSIKRAVKSQDENATKRVHVTLENTSSANAEFEQVVNMEDDLFRSLQPDVIHNIYVSLSNDDGAIISSPYEIKLEELRSGNPETVQFDLLQDVDEVTVNIIYGNGASRSPKVFLEKDASANKVLIQSERFSQEIELGADATYGLGLELFSGLNDTYKLEVVNLPRSVTRYFQEVGAAGRISQIRFTETNNNIAANLQISLPDRPTDDVPMDQVVDFYVLAIPVTQLNEFDSDPSKIWSTEEIEALDVGFVRLEMIPRGVGRLMVRTPQLYDEYAGEGEIEFTFQVINEGTRRLDNIEFELDTPFEWERRIEPAIIPALDIREEQTVKLYLTPPDDISVGRYETRMRSTSLSDNQPVNAEDKTFTVSVAAQANVFGTAIILMLIIGLVGGLVFFGIKLSKK